MKLEIISQVLLVLLCASFCFGQSSVYSCDVESFNKLKDMESVLTALERIQTNIGLVKKQLEVINESKIMKIGMAQAFEVLGNDANMASQEFLDLFEKTKNELLQVVKIERELIVKQRVLEISEAVLENKDETMRSSYLKRMGYSFREENCKCFDVVSGNPCDKSTSTVEITPVTFKDSNVFALSDINFLPKSCKEYHDNYNKGNLTSGLYLVKPNTESEPFTVYCDMRGGWTYLNGIGSTSTPSSSPVPPILPSVVNTLEFQAVLTTVTEIKSSLGDRCVLDVKNSEVQNFGDSVMNAMCKGVAYFYEGISFIKYFAK